jgi:hypothetical protein
LKDWKTIPISLRIAAMLRMSSVSSMPSTKISPRWCSSSRLMVLMKVDLPDDHLAALDGQVDAAQDVQLPEPLVDVAADDDV